MYPRITQFIKNHGIKMVAVQKRLGLSAPALKSKIDGKTDFKASEIASLADWWGVTTDYLIRND